jgi:hypothetical protein
MKDPAWANDYAKRAEAGCACADAACLDKAHLELEAMVTEHGGIDDAPPGVHTAHGKFDRCWRDGTKDIARDFEHVAQTICTCATADCLRLAKIELAGYADGKYREDFDAQVRASERATVAMRRTAECVAKVTMPADLAMTVISTTTEAMCACRDLACAQSVMKQREAAMAKYIDIDGAVDTTKLATYASRWCGCLEKVATEEIRNMSPVPALTSVNVSMSCR